MSMALRPLSSQSEVLFDPKSELFLSEVARFKSLGAVGQWAELVNWGRPPQTLSKEEQGLFKDARKEVYDFLISTKDQEKQCLAAELLQMLFALDPIEEKTVRNLYPIICQFSQFLIANYRQLPSRLLEALIKTYASGIETILSQIQKGNMLSVSEEGRKELSQIQKAISEFSAQDTVQAGFYIQYVIEGIKRLLAIEHKELFLFDRMVKVAALTHEVGSELFETKWAEAEAAFDSEEKPENSWFEECFLMRQLSERSSPSSVSDTANYLSRLVSKKIKPTAPPALSIQIESAASASASVSDREPLNWQFCMGFGRAFENLTRYSTAEEKETLFKQVFKNSSYFNSLNDLASKADDPKKAELGLQEVKLFGKILETSGKFGKEGTKNFLQKNYEEPSKNLAKNWFSGFIGNTTESNAFLEPSNLGRVPLFKEENLEEVPPFMGVEKQHQNVLVSDEENA